MCVLSQKESYGFGVQMVLTICVYSMRFARGASMPEHIGMRRTQNAGAQHAVARGTGEKTEIGGYIIKNSFKKEW